MEGQTLFQTTFLFQQKTVIEATWKNVKFNKPKELQEVLKLYLSEEKSIENCIKEYILSVLRVKILMLNRKI
jgi:hypothetical protein